MNEANQEGIIMMLLLVGAIVAWGYWALRFIKQWQREEEQWAERQRQMREIERQRHEARNYRRLGQ